MTRAEFDKLMDTDLYAYLRGLRDEKEGEYANKGDTLLNFHRMGPFYGLTPAQYCLILLGKHVQGIANQVMSGKWKWAYRLPDGGEGLKQRLADLINYGGLLFALLSEEAEARMAHPFCPNCGAAMRDRAQSRVGEWECVECQRTYEKAIGEVGPDGVWRMLQGDALTAVVMARDADG
jgi:hypothetical protein